MSDAEAAMKSVELWYYGLPNDQGDNYNTLFTADGNETPQALNEDTRTHGAFMIDRTATKTGCAVHDCGGQIGIRVTCYFEGSRDGYGNPVVGKPLGKTSTAGKVNTWT